MNDELNKEDCEFILECLSNTRLAFEGTHYPDAATRLKQLERVDVAERKVRVLRDNC